MNKVKVFFTVKGKVSPTSEMPLVDAFNKARKMAIDRECCVVLNIYLPSSPLARKFLIYDEKGYIKELNPQIRFS